MNRPERTAGAMPGSVRLLRVPALKSWHWRLLAYALSTFGAIAWTLYAGKDLNWDAINYHLYAGFAALNDRFDLDFFAASAQGYLTPYAYVPLYLMVKAGWNSTAIGIAFAVVHSINLWLTYELTLSLLPGVRAARRFALAFLAIVLAALNPLFMQETGSTFADITTSIFVLGGWLALARSFQEPRARWAWFAGALLGLATALKLSNALYAIAALPIVLMIPGRRHARMRSLLSFCGACGIVFILVAGPWAWQLWRHYGNPFFPLFNQIFASPDFTTEPIKDQRFIPATLHDALMRPLRMILPEPLIHTEPRAPDARYAALLVLLAIWAGSRLWRRRQLHPFAPRQQEPTTADAGNRPLIALLSGFLLAWILWLSASGNSRYFISMSCVAAALIVTILMKAFGNARGWIYFSLLLLTAQITQDVVAARYRWSPLEWDGPWFRVGIPEHLRKQPFYYVAFGQQSASFFLPFLASGSGMMNIGAPLPLEPNGPGGDRAVELIRSHSANLRVLFSSGYLRANGEPLFSATSEIDRILWSFSLQIDPENCETLSLFGGEPPRVFRDSANTADSTTAIDRSTVYYRACKLIPATPSSLIESREQHDRSNTVFDRVEDACPKLFRPRRISSQYIGAGIWNRVYVNTDMVLWIREGLVKFRNPVRGGDPIVIGTEADWLKTPQPMDCTKVYAPPFGGLFEDK